MTRFRAPRTHTLASVGNKVWRLELLKRAGFPIPTGGTIAFVGQHVTRNAIDRQFHPTTRRLPLWSIRSGAEVSMPGMMSTVLNAGWIPSLHRQYYDLATVDRIEDRWRKDFAEIGIKAEEIPTDYIGQIYAAVQGVQRSFYSERCTEYRKRHGIKLKGTAVSGRQMVFGLGPNSGTGVLFTQNPNTGENVPFGEWLPNAQGPDLVSGEVTPLPLHTLAEQMRSQYVKVASYGSKAAELFGCPQELEFTIENGKVWILQTRDAKMSPTVEV